MISVSFYATVAAAPVTKVTNSGKQFTIVKLRTEKKGQAGVKQSVWEVTVWGGMGAKLAGCLVGAPLVCMGTIEMMDFEYNGKSYSKPQITLNHVGIVARSELKNEPSGTTRAIASFNPTVFATSSGSSAPFDANPGNYDDIPF